MENPSVHFSWLNKAEAGVLGGVLLVQVASIHSLAFGKLMGLRHLGCELRASHPMCLIQLLYPPTALADHTDFQRILEDIDKL
jgi:hypothetical protein